MRACFYKSVACGLVGLLFAFGARPLRAYSFSFGSGDPLYTPPGYGVGFKEGYSFSMGTSIKEVNDDYYVDVVPRVGMPFFGLRVGFQFPLEVLVLDRDPSTGEDVPSVKQDSYEQPEDAAQFINFIAKGTFQHFDPEDDYNWSFYVGQMTNGYLGHKTIIHRYTSTLDSTYYRASGQFDINNVYGGIEYFQNDILTREVIGSRVYIRPFGILGRVFGGTAHSLPSTRNVRTSLAEARDPDLNGGILFQEKIPDQRRGRIKQYFHGKIPRGEAGNQRFEEYTDPVTGEKSIRAVPDDRANDRKEKWEGGFWSRFAIGYTSVQDLEAPLELEKDGSGNLVYDPDNNLPRTAQSDPLRTEDGYALCGDFGIYNACDPEAETLTVRGIDAEFRLSPFKNMNITPYVDMNEFRHINDDQASFISELNSDGSVAEYNFNIVDEDPRGIHYGIDIEFRASQNLRLSVRPELRQMDSNYIPTYFDSYYSLERSVYDPEGTGSVSQTKLEYLQSLEAGGTQVQGYFLEARLEYLPSEFVIDLEYTDYEGEDNSTVFLGLYFPDIILGISINGYYEKKNFNDYEEAFEYDQRSLAAAQVYKTFGLFKVGVNYVRTWEFNEDSGEYEPMDTKGLFFTFDTSF